MSWIENPGSPYNRGYREGCRRALLDAEHMVAGLTAGDVEHDANTALEQRAVERTLFVVAARIRAMGGEK